MPLADQSEFTGYTVILLPGSGGVNGSTLSASFRGMSHPLVGEIATQYSCPQ
jgi:hypothetical protein